MANWDEGYVSEINYTYGYYRELSPDFIDFALLLRGIEAPARGPETAYCELGFGQGLSIGIHCAANPAINFVGTDFNPGHASFAQSLSRAAGTTPRLYEDSFAQLAARTDLPQFDYIGLHGIWTWISRENHKIVVDFIRQRLKPGGVLYISYNTLPGWGPLMPLRNLIYLHAEYAGAGTQGVVGKLNNAIDFAKTLFEKNPLYGTMVPAAKSRLEKLATQDRNYMAHEYLTKDWIPMYFTDMAEQLSEAKLEFCGSSQLIDSLDNVSLPPEMRDFLNTITHPLLREQTRDYLVNQQFRRDIFVRGPRRIDSLTHRDRVLDTRVILAIPPEDVAMKQQTTMGQITMQEAVYKPLLDALASDNYRPKTLRELLPATTNLQSLAQAITILVNSSCVAPVRCDETINASRIHCSQLNNHLLGLSRTTGNISNLVSPVTGFGIPVSRFHQLFMLSKINGGTTQDEWVQFAWKVLQEIGQRMTKEGKPLETPEENIAEINALAIDFVRRLPAYAALEIL